MADLIIDNPNLAHQLNRLAKEEGKSVEVLLVEMLVERMSQAQRHLDPIISVEQVQHKAFEQARRYWQEQGDTERANLSDEQLADLFWCFDPDGIPRLKGDTVEIPDNPLLKMAEEAQAEAATEKFPDRPLSLSENASNLAGRAMIEHYLLRRHETDTH